MDVSLGLISRLIKCKSMQRALAPVASHVSLLVILSERGSEELGTDRHGFPSTNQFYVDNDGPTTPDDPHLSIAVCATSIASCVDQFISLGEVESKSSADQMFKNQMSAACETLELAKTDLFVWSQRHQGALSHQSTSGTQHALGQAAKNVLQGVVKVLLAVDDRDVRHLVGVVEETQKAVFAVKKVGENSHLVPAFKVLTESVLRLKQVIDKRRADLCSSACQQDLAASMNALRKAVPSLSMAAQTALKYKNNNSAQASCESVIEDMLLNLSKIERVLKSGAALVTNDDDESENTSFVTVVDSVMDSLSEENRLPLSPDLESFIVTLVRHGMAVAHLASGVHRELVVSSCHRILQAKSRLLELSGSLEGRPSIPHIELEYGKVCELILDEVCDLEKHVNMTLLQLVVETFMLTTEPLDTLVKMAIGYKDDLVPFTEVHKSAIQKFTRHADSICQVASLVAASSTDLKRVSDLQSAVQCLESLDPDMVPSVIHVAQCPTDQAGLRHLRLLVKRWHLELDLMVKAIDRMVDPGVFLDRTAARLQTEIDSLTDLSGILDRHKQKKSISTCVHLGQRAAQIGERIVDAHVDPVYRNGLLTFVKKVMEACSLARAAAHDMLSNPPSTKLSDTLQRRLLLLHGAVVDLRGGLDARNHPHILSEERRLARNQPRPDYFRTKDASTQSKNHMNPDPTCHGIANIFNHPHAPVTLTREVETAAVQSDRDPAPSSGFSKNQETQTGLLEGQGQNMSGQDQNLLEGQSVAQSQFQPVQAVQVQEQQNSVTSGREQSLSIRQNQDPQIHQNQLSSVGQNQILQSSQGQILNEDQNQVPNTVQSEILTEGQGEIRRQGGGVSSNSTAVRGHMMAKSQEDELSSRSNGVLNVQSWPVVTVQREPKIIENKEANPCPEIELVARRLLAACTSKDKVSTDALTGEVLGWTNHIIEAGETLMAMGGNVPKAKELRSLVRSIDQLAPEVVQKAKFVAAGDQSALPAFVEESAQWSKMLERARIIVDVAADKWMMITETLVQALDARDDIEIKAMVSAITQAQNEMSKILTKSRLLQGHYMDTGADRLTFLSDCEKDLDTLATTICTTVEIALVSVTRTSSDRWQMTQVCRDWSVLMTSVSWVLDSIADVMETRGRETFSRLSGVHLGLGAHNDTRLADVLQRETDHILELVDCVVCGDEILKRRSEGYVAEVQCAMKDVWDIVKQPVGPSPAPQYTHLCRIKLGLAKSRWIEKALDLIELIRHNCWEYTGPLRLVLQASLDLDKAENMTPTQRTVEKDTMANEFLNTSSQVKQKALAMVQTCSDLPRKTVVRSTLDDISKLTPIILAAIRNQEGTLNEVNSYSLADQWGAKIRKLVINLKKMDDVRPGLVSEIERLTKKSSTLDSDIHRHPALENSQQHHQQQHQLLLSSQNGHQSMTSPQPTNDEFSSPSRKSVQGLLRDAQFLDHTLHKWLDGFDPNPDLDDPEVNKGYSSKVVYSALEMARLCSNMALFTKGGGTFQTSSDVNGAASSILEHNQIVTQFARQLLTLTTDPRLSANLKVCINKMEGLASQLDIISTALYNSAKSDQGDRMLVRNSCNLVHTVRQMFEVVESIAVKHAPAPANPSSQIQEIITLLAKLRSLHETYLSRERLTDQIDELGLRRMEQHNPPSITSLIEVPGLR